MLFMINIVNVVVVRRIYILITPGSQRVNPLTPRSDQYINSSNNFNTLSSKLVMRTKRIIK